MNTYTSYYTFFSENIKIIKDIQADFKAENISGVIFDKTYRTFLNKFIARCHTFSGETFRGSSRVISNYISEISNTKSESQHQRFEKLLKITEQYMRVSM